MASHTKCGPQDLPPKDGYKTVQPERIVLNAIFKAKKFIPMLIVVNATALYIHYHTSKRIKRGEIEMRSSRFATIASLLAERDREFLKQLRRNRDIEEKLMKNYPNWEVGTLNGEPVYKTITDERLLEPGYFEFFAHSGSIVHDRLHIRFL